MIRKFAKVPECRIALGLMLAAILAGATTVHAQQTPPASPPPAQQPTTQAPADQSSSGQSTSGQTSSSQSASSQSSSQEASPEEVGSRRKVKPKEYKNWSFNAGGGGSLPNGVTNKFVRGGGPIAAVGVARNYSKYFGLRVDFQFDNLPLRNSALELAQAPGATSHVYSFTFDPIINIPVNSKWGGYLVFGPAFYHRSGKLDSSSAQPGSACNAFWNWWGTCLAGSLPLNQQFLSTTQNEFGENFGGGITRRLTPKFELYGEFRYLHGSGGGRTTDLRPITIGLRW